MIAVPLPLSMFLKIKAMNIDIITVRGMNHVVRQAVLFLLQPPLATLLRSKACAGQNPQVLWSKECSRKCTIVVSIFFSAIPL